jgi:hypothetical protein
MATAATTASDTIAVAPSPDAEPVARRELLQPIPRARRTREHRLAGEPPIDIGQQRVDRRVPGGRLLGQAAQRDGVEFGSQHAAQRLGSRAARLRRRHQQMAPARRARIDLEDGALQRRGRLGALVRPLAAQQLVEHHAQRVHVAGRRERQSRKLLRARVARRQRAAGLARELGLGDGVALGVEQLGDPEVQQPHLTLRRDQDVGRLQVAVDDEVRVCMLHGQQHLAEEPHALAQRQPALVAPGRDRLALDVLQREPRLPVARDAGVEQTRDVRMAQRGEDVALALEAHGERLAAGTRVRQLDGHAPLEDAVVALGEPHLGHAALAQRMHQAVGDRRGGRRPTPRHPPARAARDAGSVPRKSSVTRCARASSMRLSCGSNGLPAASSRASHPGSE